MKLKNLTQEEACQTLLSILPQEVKDTFKLFQEIEMPDVSLHRLKSLQDNRLDNKQFSKGKEFYAWVYWHKGSIYFVCPGKEEAFKTNEKAFHLQSVNLGQVIPITYKINMVQNETQDYRLISSSEGNLRLVPAWWLDVNKVINCYYCSSNKVKYRLQQIHLGKRKMFAWRLISVKPVSIQWFVIEKGTFIKECDIQKNLWLISKSSVTEQDGIVKFK